MKIKLTNSQTYRQWKKETFQKIKPERFRLYDKCQTTYTSDKEFDWVTTTSSKLTDFTSVPRKVRSLYLHCLIKLFPMVCVRRIRTIPEKIIFTRISIALSGLSTYKAIAFSCTYCALLLTESPSAEPVDREVSRSNRKVVSMLGDSLMNLMIVGGNQDTTEPLCLDGMTYKGTCCGLKCRVYILC